MDHKPTDDELDAWWDALTKDEQSLVLAVRQGAFPYDDPVRAIIDSSNCPVPPPWVFGGADSRPLAVAPGTPAECLMPGLVRDYLTVRFPEAPMGMVPR
jgi:hypothetical protein